VSSVELRELAKGFGGVAAVRGVSALVPQGELLALLGPSGCGKTTTLRMLAGIIRPDAGRVVFGERDVTRLPPESRDVGLVFQHYALFPHRSVADNVAFGLRMRKHRKAERREPVRQMLERLRLDGLGGRLPAELSGGQRQRVALGRALVTRPSVLLLDEPLSNLDANLREEMRFYIRELVTEFGITTIYVTHDQAEALAMADRIAVMMDGRIAQIAPPQDTYHRPASRRVAAFVGVANLLPGRVVEDDGTLATVTGTWGTARSDRASPCAPGDQVTISIRPEDIAVSPAPPDTSPHELRPAGDGARTAGHGTLTQAAYLGSAMDYRIGVAGLGLRVQGDPRHRLAAGEAVRVEFSAATAWAVPDAEPALPVAATAAGRA
jgi:putative spermidine/putrescine transport system ATP-binding protein